VDSSSDPFSGGSVGLSATDFSSAVTAITSAFGDPTRRDIFLFVSSHAEGVTASEVADEFDLHANVARHHLDKLAGGGYLDIRLEKRSGAGRPSKHYRIVSDGVHLEFAVRHDDILVTLLGRALARLGPDTAQEIAVEVGREYGKTMATSLSEGEAQQSFRSALHAVAEALSAHGFAAHAERDGDELRIVSRHCPFGDAAVEHPVICAVDRGMVEGMLGALYGETRVELAGTLSGGDDACVTSVTDGAAPLGVDS
jgi:predicted ArsR family transcriptional regulator